MKRLPGRYINLLVPSLLLLMPLSVIAVEKVSVTSKSPITMTVKKQQSLNVQGSTVQNARSVSILSAKNKPVKAFKTSLSCKVPSRKGGKGNCDVKLTITGAVPTGKYTLNLMDAKRQVLAAGQFDVRSDPAVARAAAVRKQQAAAKQKADATRAAAVKKQEVAFKRKAELAARQKAAITQNKGRASVLQDTVARAAQATRKPAVDASIVKAADPQMRQRVVQTSSDNRAQAISKAVVATADTQLTMSVGRAGVAVMEGERGVQGTNLMGQGQRVTAPDGTLITVGIPSQTVTIYDYKINDGSGRTEDRDVVLYHNTTNNPTHYRVAESPNWSQVAWIPYASDPAYTLSSSEGKKNVFLQVKGQDLTDFLGNPQPNIVTVSTSIGYFLEPLVVSNFRIEDGATNVSKRQVVLTWAVSGIADEYRISESSSMEGVSWTLGSSPPSAGLVFDLQEGAAGSRTLYLQVKRYNSEPVSTDASINISVGICPIGHRNLECSGAGVCSVSGQCACDIDLSGPACKTITQRCFGAMGTHCSPGDGGLNISGIAGLCLGGTCGITVGSWIHDECCVRHRKGTPNPVEGSSCSVGGDVCQTEFIKVLTDLGRQFVWTREINPLLERTTDSDTLDVDFEAMCAPTNAAIACTDSKYCCSRSVNGNSLVGCRCQ